MGKILEYKNVLHERINQRERKTTEKKEC